MKASTIDPIQHAIRLFLKPIARFCVKRSIKLQTIIEALKLALLEIAREDMTKSGQQVTASRLSIMTGVHRKDVMRLLDRKEVKRPEAVLTSRILAKWRSSPEYKSITGRPKALLIEGASSEFAELVRSVSKELNPYTILFELERSGSIVRTGDRVKLKGEIFRPKGDVRQSLELLASDVDDLFAAVSENIFDAPKIPNHHITTSYDNITTSAVPKIRAWLLREGDELHQRAREFLSKYDRDSNPSLRKEKGGVTVSLGSVSRVYGVSTTEEEA